MTSSTEALPEMEANEAQFDFEALYPHMSRVVAGVVRDPARAEELAVVVKLWRNRQSQGEHAEGWLYGAAVCLGLDELWRQAPHAIRTSFRICRQDPHAGRRKR